MTRRFIGFTALSLLGLVLVSYLLLVVFQRINRSTLEGHYFEHNILLAQTLRNGLYDSGLNYMLSSVDPAVSSEASPAIFENNLKELLRDLPVVKLKVFNTQGVTVYSSTVSETGSDASKNKGVINALAGSSISSTVRRDEFNSFDGLIENRNLYQQYIPIKATQSGDVIGVFEIYSDITNHLEMIDATQKNFLIGMLAVLGSFFLIQVWLYHLTEWALSSEKRKTDRYLRELEENSLKLEERVSKRTQELESSHAFLQSVINGIANPLFVINPDLKVSLMNRAAMELIPDNADPEEFTHCYQISHRRDTPCTGEDHPCSFLEIVKHQSQITVQHNHFDAKNNPIVVDVISTPMFDETGKLSGIIEVEHDVTELENARKRLAQSEENLQAILDHVPDAILTLGDAGQIESVNEAATRLFELRTEELLNKKFSSLICDFDTNSDMAIEGNVREALAYRNHNGKFPVDIWIDALNLGEKQCYIAVVRDIEKRKIAESELEQTRTQYYHQDKMAAIGQLAAGILHEVGNPIAAISGAAMDIHYARTSSGSNHSNCEYDEAVNRNLILIEEHTERLAKITRDVATFASPRVSERELSDINSLISNTTRLLSYDRRFRGVKLTQSLNPHLPAIEIVPDQITQVLMNIIINSLDAVRSEENTISEIKLFSRMKEESIEIEVWDNGAGMDKEKMERALEPFYTTKEPGKGTGLGLSLCDSIVMAHNGEIRINSEPNLGTSVIVSLPVFLTTNIHSDAKATL